LERRADSSRPGYRLRHGEGEYRKTGLWRSEADGGFEALAILPLHVIGPLMSSNHDQSWSWQNHIKRMMQGKPY
jgi:hypothetical protein